MTQKSRLEERLARLEETTFFQEKLIADLSDALTAQQTEINGLERRAAALEARLDNLTRHLEFSRTSGGNEPELPPHYL